ncbi:MAG TPA: DUF1353 domain-containing protein [Nocardioides sp.]|nr:DUF1353 domain-containing protein [Nocardioides sp.]
MHLSRVVRQPQRFFDGGAPGEPPDPGSPLRIVLARHVVDGVESFSLDRTIGYDDRRLGRLLVPAAAGFRTDLTSVPWLFAWLVPRTGAHLPAALLHDGLVGGADGGASYVSEHGHEVTRDEADRVFRDAMADTGTGVVRRWLVWTAVTIATIFVGSSRWTATERTRHRAAAALTIGVVVVLGTLATLDLVDAGPRLPWMGDRLWWSELIGGLAGAVVIPVLLGLTWGRFRLAGAIAGVALAVLLHVSVALLLLTGLYWSAERLAQQAPVVAAVGTVLLVAASGVVLIGYVLG